MEPNTKKLLLKVTAEQEDKIRHLYQEEGWVYLPEIVESAEGEICPDVEIRCESSAAPQVAMCGPMPPVAQASHGMECPYCFCTPCVTSDPYKQLWFPEQRLPHENNRKSRRNIYKKFWGFMSNLHLWRDPRYLQRKEQALSMDPRCTTYVWIKSVKKREIMPNCVLKFVRGALPSPNGIYMNHLWE